MSARRHAAVLVIVAGAMTAAAGSAQRDVDVALLADIEAIKAIDNHAHVMRPVPDDRGFDALPLDALDPSPLPVGLRDDNPMFVPRVEGALRVPLRRRVGVARARGGGGEATGD